MITAAGTITLLGDSNDGSQGGIGQGAGGAVAVADNSVVDATGATGISLTTSGSVTIAQLTAGSGTLPQGGNVDVTAGTDITVDGTLTAIAGSVETTPTVSLTAGNAILQGTAGEIGSVGTITLGAVTTIGGTVLADRVAVADGSTVAASVSGTVAATDGIFLTSTGTIDVAGIATVQNPLTMPAPLGGDIEIYAGGAITQGSGTINSGSGIVKLDATTTIGGTDVADRVVLAADSTVDATVSSAVVAEDGIFLTSAGAITLGDVDTTQAGVLGGDIEVTATTAAGDIEIAGLILSDNDLTLNAAGTTGISYTSGYLTTTSSNGVTDLNATHAAGSVGSMAAPILFNSPTTFTQLISGTAGDNFYVGTNAALTSVLNFYIEGAITATTGNVGISTIENIYQGTAGLISAPTGTITLVADNDGAGTVDYWDNNGDGFGRIGSALTSVIVADGSNVTALATVGVSSIRGINISTPGSLTLSSAVTSGDIAITAATDITLDGAVTSTGIDNVALSAGNAILQGTAGEISSAGTITLDAVTTIGGTDLADRVAVAGGSTVDATVSGTVDATDGIFLTSTGELIAGGIDTTVATSGGQIELSAGSITQGSGEIDSDSDIVKLDAVTTIGGTDVADRVVVADDSIVDASVSGTVAATDGIFLAGDWIYLAGIDTVQDPATMPDPLGGDIEITASMILQDSGVIDSGSDRVKLDSTAFDSIGESGDAVLLAGGDQIDAISGASIHLSTVAGDLIVAAGGINGVSDVVLTAFNDILAADGDPGDSVVSSTGGTIRLVADSSGANGSGSVGTSSSAIEVGSLVSADAFDGVFIDDSGTLTIAAAGISTDTGDVELSAVESILAESVVVAESVVSAGPAGKIVLWADAPILGAASDGVGSIGLLGAPVIIGTGVQTVNATAGEGIFLAQPASGGPVSSLTLTNVSASNDGGSGDIQIDVGGAALTGLDLILDGGVTNNLGNNILLTAGNDTSAFLGRS